MTIRNIGNDGSVNMNEASYIEKDYDNSLNKYSVTNGNMIFAMSGNTIGKLGIIATNIKNVLINQRVLIIKTSIENISYPYFIIKDKKMQNSIVQMGTNSAQPNISEEALRSFRICLPNQHVLNRYNWYCSNFFNSIIMNRIENQELVSLRNFLLPLLMNGQIGFKDE